MLPAEASRFDGRSRAHSRCSPQKMYSVERDNQDEKVPTIKMRKPMSRTLGGRA